MKRRVKSRGGKRFRNRGEEKGKSLWIIIFTIIFVLLVAALIFMTGFSRYTGNASLGIDLRQGSEQIIQAVNDWISPFLEVALGVSAVDKYFFSKVLVFIIMLIVVYAALNKIELFSGHRNLMFILDFVVSLLSIRYIVNTDIINFILLPYGALGAAITCFLPFVIFFYFVENNVKGSAGRRLAWIVYGLFFIGLWISRWSEIGGSWVYTIGIVAIGVSMAFDQQIHGYFASRETLERKRTLLENRQRSILRQMQQLTADKSSGIVGRNEFDREMKRLEDDLDDVARRMP